MGQYSSWEMPLPGTRAARAEADAALTDLLEQHDGHLPPDYDGDHEPQSEPLTTKEREAYPDFVQIIRDADPDIAPAYGTLPTATPRFADEPLVAGSERAHRKPKSKFTKSGLSPRR
jgi:hypothetical protein